MQFSNNSFIEGRLGWHGLIHLGIGHAQHGLQSQKVASKNYTLKWLYPKMDNRALVHKNKSKAIISRDANKSPVLEMHVQP